MKVLVLGGHGFVGKHTAEQLKNTEHETICLSRIDGLDMTKYETVAEHFNKYKPDTIINLAAHVGSLHYVTEKAADVVDDNMQIILNLYRAAKETCPNAKIINPISNCSYPGEANIQKETEYWNGPVHKSVWSYGNPRRMIAVVSECYTMQYKMNTINFIAPNSYGPGDYTDPNKTHALNGMIIRMLKAKQNNQPEFEIWGTGKPTREWIYVKDLAKMLVQAVDKQESQIIPVNIAQNKAYSIKETAETIKQSINYEGKLLFNAKYQDGAPTKQLDDLVFREKYPEFKFTNITTGIKETIEYYKDALGV